MFTLFFQLSMHSVAPPLMAVPGIAVSTQPATTTSSTTTNINSVTSISSVTHYRTTESKTEPCKGSHENLFDSASSDGASDDEVWAPMPVRGTLSKWTNLLHGWQERYFVLSDGMLTYYRNSDELGLGSRGAVRVRLADVKAHEYDDCRFEVRVGESIWYLRGLSASQRDVWMSAIERHRVAESGYGSEKTLNRPSSLLSLNSGHSPSIASSSSFKRSRRLREKLAEMETFKDLLCKQVDSLQAYFDACNMIMQHVAPDRLQDWVDGTVNVDSDLPNDDARPSDGTPWCQETEEKEEDHLISHHSVEADLPPQFSNPQVTNLRGVQSTPEGNESCTDEDDDHYLTPTPSVAARTPKSNRRSADDAFPPSSSGGGVGGFFSRFLPFRSNSQSTPPQPPTVTVQSATKSSKNENFGSEPTVTRSSSRFENLKRVLKRHGAYALDFRGESHMFKATAAGILTNLSHTIELMQQNEEQWRKRLEREIEKKRRIEETQRAMAQELAHLRQITGLEVSAATATTPGSTHSHPGLSNGHSRFPTHSRILSCGSVDTHEPASYDMARTGHIGSRPPYGLAGPDLEEGPNSPIREEEFYDAIDAESDRIEQDDLRLAALKSAGELLRSAQAMPTTHPLYTQLEKAVAERIRNFANSQAFLPPGQRASRSTNDLSNSVLRTQSSVLWTDGPTGNGLDSTDDWQVIAEEGEMIIYKREMETEDGVVLDPLQAVHVVPGVTAREMCSYFWDVRYRMDWEFTIDQAPTVLEVCGDDTVVLHQVYKRVWPTTQRDSVFWSHIRQVSTRFPPTLTKGDNQPAGDVSRTHHRSLSVDSWTRPDAKVLTQSIRLDSVSRLPALLGQTEPRGSDDVDGVLDSWMVVNMSTDYQADKVPTSASPIIRLGLDVILYCQTVLVPASEKTSFGNLFSRDRLRTRLVYIANINPGGWVPAAGLRTLARREYPRFLRRFSAYVQEQTKDKPPMF
ncbi:Collagen type IV alpha-3-binding protein [Fasciola hepatica]|uniref:Collagen type IV alpha-3-binding protein n=1 Tax=Fasciola hepatica TaxID=6192 RepID=A0A4E0RB85_FASHE|nr:Collagen type IV alpha-3-binding protein [Fasciola hepatica]